MALGRPLLTSVRPGLYVVEPPVISSRDPAELATVASQLLDSETERTTLGSSAAEWVQRIHDPQRVAGQLLALYRRLAG